MDQLYKGLGIFAVAVTMAFGAAAADSSFSTGKWAGWWTSMDSDAEVLEATIEVHSITPNADGTSTAAGRTDWGDAMKWNVAAGGFAYKKGVIKGSTLTVGRQPVLVYELQSDGSLKGIRYVDDRPTGRITLRRVGQ